MDMGRVGMEMSVSPNETQGSDKWLTEGRQDPLGRQVSNSKQSKRKDSCTGQQMDTGE